VENLQFQNDFILHLYSRWFAGIVPRDNVDNSALWLFAQLDPAIDGHEVGVH